MPFDDRLGGGETVHRVYALCKIARKCTDKDKIENYLLPSSLNGDQKTLFSTVFNFAAKGGLLYEDPIDKKVIVNLTDKNLESMDSFRREINRRVFNQPELMFCRFTAWYIARGTKVYGENIDDLVAAFDSEINVGKTLNKYNSTNITAWRAWASYLGFGFVHKGILIPNVSLRIQDCIEEDKKLEKMKPLMFREFIKWLSESAPELDYGRISLDNRGTGEVSENHLSVGVSGGLRTLHNSGKIKLVYIKDSEDIWHLTKSELHNIQEYVSEVIIVG